MKQQLAFLMISVIGLLTIVITQVQFISLTSYTAQKRFWLLSVNKAPKKSSSFESTQYSFSQHGALEDKFPDMLVENSSKSEPNISHTEPIEIVWFTKHDWLRIEGFVKNCNIPCYQTSNKRKIETASAIAFQIELYDGDPRKALNGGANQAKMVAFSLESQKYYPRLKNLSDYDITVTFKFDSDVPIPYYRGPWRNLHANISDWPWEKREPAIVFIARNCHSKSHREKLVRELGRYVRVDSVSSCLKNHLWPKNVPISDKDGVLKQYRLYLAAENSIDKDYVTEKVYNGLINGAVPLYLGAPNFEEFVPHHSVIPIPSDFTTVDLVQIADIAKNIINNKTAYEEWIEFKKHPLEEWFKKKFSYGHNMKDAWCRLCRKLYAIKNGLGWDKETQKIVFN